MHGQLVFHEDILWLFDCYLNFCVSLRLVTASTTPPSYARAVTEHRELYLPSQNLTTAL